ncbi:hypothetical protein HK102_000457 [Quaeritorhiza haematococci]|nr:hypothetical protein HK102_000457 [Quaeritorhiza haematococci]
MAAATATRFARRLAGKVVFVTGASSGIGAACAHEFAREGSNLVLTARRFDRLLKLKEDILAQYPSVKVHPVELDVRSREKVNETVDNLPSEFQNISVLINNAGLVIGKDTIESVSPDAVDTMFDTNVKGLLYVTQAILPIMKRNNAGHIINVSSISGTQVYPGGGVYCATKHAVDAMTRTLRMELVDTPINVTSIDPGMVETEFSVVRFGGDKQQADKVYEGLQPLTGQDIAETIVFAASRPPHVQIASMVVFPTSQAAVTTVSRSSASKSS